MPVKKISKAKKMKKQNTKPVAKTDNEEDLGEEVSLDNEELNPFGDKWEE